jgi:hypothetical protein
MPDDLLPSDFVLEKTHASFASTGLKFRSVFRAHKLALLYKSLIFRVLGFSDDDLLGTLNERLRIALGIE